MAPLLRRGVVVSAACLLLSATSVAGAATQPSSSDEVGGGSVAARSATQNLRSAWVAQVAANGGTVQPPMTLTEPRYTSGAVVSGVINAAADGTTTSIERTQYSGDATPTPVGASRNPGTASCTTGGASLQGGAPRPTSLVDAPTCSGSAGFAYAEAGGVGENTTRDAVEFTFSRPVLAFGAWFGDLETRTDGRGVPAVVRLYGVGGRLLSDREVPPGPSYLPQSSCSNTYTGCGNNTSRWLSFVADPAEPVTRMVVIVGDEDASGSGLDEGLSLIGPTLDLSTATITLTKSADPLTDTNSDGYVGAGDTVQYNFTITNTGSLVVSALTITDPDATRLNCPARPVAPGAVATCTGVHVLTQAEVDSGSVSNTARATGRAYGGTITSNPSTTKVPLLSSPGLNLTKAVTESTFAAVGDVLDFDVTATNSGNVTLTGVSISDPNPGAGAFTSDCATAPGTLAPGAAASCGVSYTVTQADLDAGTLANVATSSATAPGAVPVGPVRATATSSAVQRVNLTLGKSVDQPTYDASGDTLTYTVTATNNGNITLTGVTVTDPAPGDGAFALDCSGLPRTLAPDDSGTCTATYAVTQDDLDAGAVTNVASATAVASGNPVAAPDAEATSTAVTRPGLSIVKNVDAPTFDTVGDVLTYTVTVTNNSNVTVHAVSVADEAPGAGAFDRDCSDLPAELAPNDVGTCTVTYTVTQADIDSGSVVNRARASALLPTNEGVESPIATASSNAEQIASLSLVKLADVETYDAVGDVLTYALTVTNGGNVTLAEIAVTDPAPADGDLVLDCRDLPSTLGPGDVGSCTAEYAVTQDDLDAGAVTNVASATATGPGGDVAAPNSQATATAQQGPALTVTKSADSAVYSGPGDALTYTVAVTNTGNVTLTGVKVTDPPPGAGAFTIDCDALPAVLAPGADGTCTATYEVTQEDVDGGSVTNTAAADANGPSGPISAASPPVTSNAEQSSSLELLKTVDAATYDAVGDRLTYTITVTNTGNVNLAALAVSDPAPGAGAFDLDCAALPLVMAPEGSATCVATYTVTQADLDAGTVVNRARATATDPQGRARRSRATVTSTAKTVRALAFDKTVSEGSYARVGDVLHYQLTARNTGNVTLTQVRIMDLAPGDGQFTTTCSGAAALSPGATSSCSATYTVAAADLSRDGVTNTATAVAPSQVQPVSASVTSGLVRPPLADTGAEDMHNTGLIGIAALLVGTSLVGLSRHPRG